MKSTSWLILYWLSLVTIGLVAGIVYFTNQAETIYGGDAGDLVATVATLGIAHPPGYPLYTLLGVLTSWVIQPGTLAWRLGFLSSLPSILTLLILFDLLFYLSRKLMPSFMAVMILAFIYPFWLYAQVVEVFALNNLFIVILLWLVFHFHKQGKRKYLYIASLVLGLAFSHHHTIVFLLPAVIFLVSRQRKTISKRAMLTCLPLFFFGLSPYLYILIAAHFSPAINWLGRVTFSNFLILFFRVGYGTFMAGRFIAHEPALRLLEVWSTLDFIVKDFRILGIILACFGFFHLFVREKLIFKTLTLGFLSYLFFIFYASFPLIGNFMVGTFERFILPLYIFIAIFIAFGFIQINILLEKIINLLLPGKSSIANLAVVLFFIYPLGIFNLNHKKISILKRDFTAENLAYDILSSVADNSILLISTDTPLFNTQYVYYTEKKWPNVKLIHLSKLYTPYYFDQLKDYYPDLLLPDKNLAAKEKFVEFIHLNYEEFPIFSKQSFAIDEGVFLPHGLLFQYFKEEDVPDDKKIVEINESLWSFYHDPLEGSLSVFENLMLSDVAKVYSIARQETGFWQARHGFFNDAEKHLLMAERLNETDLDSYLILAQVYIQQTRCDEAQEQLEYVKEKDSQETSTYFLMWLNAGLCYKDEEKASFYQKMYQEKQQMKQTPLRQL